MSRVRPPPCPPPNNPGLSKSSVDAILTGVYVIIVCVFALVFALANPSFRLWLMATKFKVKRSLGFGQAMRAQRLPGDHATAEAETEAEAEVAWQRRRGVQSKAQGRGAKPGRVTKEGGHGKSRVLASGGGSRVKRSEEQQPMMPG